MYTNSVFFGINIAHVDVTVKHLLSDLPQMFAVETHDVV